MPDPNTADFDVFDKKVADAEYIFFGLSGLPTVAVERPLTESRGRNVERYVQLQATDRVFHVDATTFGESFFTGATLDSTGAITEVHDRFVYQGLEFAVLFAEFQNFRNTAIVVCRQS